ncbi:phosphohistidine phosphatase SixA [Terracidiphilus sp.]|jgi:phosphohistidine phosphatase|uniref:phosphohistidine phosphatase SixA n=1 Tax=Terracidiphilus sp. TaxID=1964191 RepID=UPI003C17B1C1
MILYLMRHANAGLPRPNPSLDARRGLVKDGKEQCVLMARTLSAFKVQIDTVVSSPLKRALQTAQFVATELGHEAKIEINPALAPDGKYTDFQAFLAEYSNTEGVLAVGHNPNLFEFMGKLVTGNGGASLRLRKGAIARIDLNRHPAQLHWLIDPRLIRNIYASVGKSSRPKTSRK